MLPVILEPIKISQKLFISGDPPHNVNIIVKYARHEPQSFSQWKIMYDEEFIIENNELQIDLVDIEDFDVWYLEIFINVRNVFGKTNWRSGVFGILLGGFPPRLWKTRVNESLDTFLGILPKHDFLAAEFSSYVTGIIPKIDEYKVSIVGGEVQQSPSHEPVTISVH